MDTQLIGYLERLKADYITYQLEKAMLDNEFLDRDDSRITEEEWSDRPRCRNFRRLYLTLRYEAIEVTKELVPGALFEVGDNYAEVRHGRGDLIPLFSDKWWNLIEKHLRLEPGSIRQHGEWRG